MWAESIRCRKEGKLWWGSLLRSSHCGSLASGGLPGVTDSGPGTSGAEGPAETSARTKGHHNPPALHFLSPHLAPRDSPPRPRGCSQRCCWQKEADKTKAVTCVTGPEGPCEPPQSGRLQAKAPGARRRRERPGLWGHFVRGVGRPFGAWDPPVTAGPNAPAWQLQDEVCWLPSYESLLPGRAVEPGGGEGAQLHESQFLVAPVGKRPEQHGDSAWMWQGSAGQEGEPRAPLLPETLTARPPAPLALSGRPGFELTLPPSSCVGVGQAVSLKFSFLICKRGILTATS